MTKSILRMSDLSKEEILSILDAATVPSPSRVLANKGAALLFEHPSLRTRNASEMAVVQLGGHPVSIRGEEVGIDKRESAEDIARTLGSYHAIIGARVAHHEVLDRFVTALSHGGYDVPVINLLSDVEHPSQALADLLTIHQHFGSFDGQVVTFIGDANNVARSLAIACVRVGMEFRIASPEGFRFSDAEVSEISSMGLGTFVTGEPFEVADGASVLYTDVWVSMGEESDAAAKKAAFAPYCINEALVAAARSDAIVLHCLPAHRGEEITDGVLESPKSLIWNQAENRMHSLRGMLSFVMRSAFAHGATQKDESYRGGPQ